MSYTDIVICIGPNRFLETWPPIYRGQERPVMNRLSVSQVDHHVYSRYTPYLIDLYLRVHSTPYSPNPKSFILDICRVNPHHTLWHFYAFSGTNLLTRCHSASSYYLLFLCFRKVTHEIFSELDKTKAKVPIYLTRRRGPKERRRGARGQTHHRVAQATPGHATRWCGPLVHPLTSPFRL
jgi:hypothetical protein